MDAVVAEAVALLDEAGDAALTFRALAARLGGGVASIYWYVSSRDELLDRASDHVVGEVLAMAPSVDSGDPIDDLRATGVALFDAVIDRPWLGAYFMRHTDTQPNSLRLYDRIGQQVMRLGLPARESFHAVSAVLGFVVGIAADLGQGPPVEVANGSISREDYIGRYADQWRATDAEEFPFLHFIADEFATHSDREQFRAGFDLLLDGLSRQAAVIGQSLDK